MTNNTLKASKKADISHTRVQRFSYPSSHAAKRISQRTSMNILELMLLLDNQGFVNIGQAAGSHSRHLLFYSPKDKFCYIAIQDANYGKVITVWPPSYHKNLAWRITDEQYQLAKLRYYSYIDNTTAQTIVPQHNLSDSDRQIICQDISSNTSKPVKYRTVTGIKRFYSIWVQALYINQALMPKRKTLFKVTIGYYIDDFQKSIDELLQNPSLYQQIDDGIQKKRLYQGSVYAINIRHKRYPTLFRIITLRCQSDAVDHMSLYQLQHRMMLWLLSRYLTDKVALPLPSSMRRLRLSWVRSIS